MQFIVAGVGSAWQLVEDVAEALLKMASVMLVDRHPRQDEHGATTVRA